MRLVDGKGGDFLVKFVKNIDSFVCILVVECSLGGSGCMRDMIVIQPFCYVVVILFFGVSIQIFSSYPLDHFS